MFPDTLAVIGVHSAKFPAERLSANLRAAVLRYGIEHPVVNDADFAVWHQYAVRAWPTLVLIDPRGRVVASRSGEVTAEQLAPEIERLVTEAEATGILDRAPLGLAGEAMGEAASEPERPLAFPSKLLATADGRLFIADTGHHRVLELRLARDGRSAEVRRVFGTGRSGLADGPAEEAAFHRPRGLALAGDRLYVADTENHAVRAVHLGTGWVRTLAGTGEKAHGSFALGAPTATPLRSPWAVLAEADFVFIAMAGSHQVWVLVEESQIGPFAGNGREALVDGPREQASFNQPSDLACGLGHLFVADTEASAVRAITLGELPRVFTLVGMGLFEFGDRDGRGNQVRLQHPTGLAFGDGLLYVADSYNHKIKTLDPTTGEVKTLLGTGQAGHNDGLFSRATFYEPEGLALAGRRLYVADTNNHLVRVADLDSRLVRTLELGGLDRPQPAGARSAGPGA
jgi:sugar lactone lactonase YvrE